MKGYLTVIVIATVSGFLLSLELRYIYRRLWTQPPRVLMVVALAVAATCSRSSGA